MKQHIKRWSWRLLRLVVIAAAVGYIIWKVDWNDQATLLDALGVEGDFAGSGMRVVATNEHRVNRDRAGGHGSPHSSSF